MWIELKKTVQNLIDIESDKKRLNAFVIERYDEKFKDIKIDTGYQHYFKYEIINENKIKIYYKYGIGDYDYIDSFDVDMLPYYRDNIITEILN
jgi:hypothetical protein